MRWGAGVLVALVLAGCGAETASSERAESTSSSSSSTSSASPVAAVPEVPRIAAEAVQLRTDAAIGGQVQVRITNTGADAFQVTSVQLDSPGFASLPATAVTARYAPGRTIDLPTPFGTVDCAVGVEPVAARVTVVRPDGTREELRLPLTGDTMAQVHDSACAIAGVLAVVDITVEDLADAGQTSTGIVVLSRRSGEEPVEVSQLGGSVVLDAVADDLAVTLAAQEQELRIPVTFDAARCDPHALAEAKKPFVFPLAVTVGNGESVPVPLPLDDAQKDLLQGLLDRVCVN